MSEQKISELRMEMEEMKQKMMETERKRREDKAEMETTLRNINIRLDGVYTVLNNGTTRLTNEIKEWKDKSKLKMEELESQSKVRLEMLDRKMKSLSQSVNNTRKYLKKDLQNLKIQTEKQCEKSSAIEEEMTSLKSETTSEIEKLKSECLNEMKNLVSEIKQMDEMSEVIQTKMDECKTEVETELAKAKAETVFLLEEQNKGVNDFKKNLMAEFEEEFNRYRSIVDRKLNQGALQLSNRIIDNLSKELASKTDHLLSASQQQTSSFQINPQMCLFNPCEKNVNFLPDFTWKIKGCKEKMMQKKFPLKSGVFFWNEYSVQAEVQLRLKQNDEVYVSLNLKRYKVGKAIVDLKPILSVYYVLRDRSSKAQTKHISRSVSYQFKKKFDYSLNYEKFVTHKSRFTKKLYYVNDCVVMEIYVEPPLMTNIVHSCNGILNWTIDNYRKRKQMEIKTLVWGQESPYFYTGPRGYRVQACMYLNGWGKYVGKGLSMSISFLTGEFDEELSMNFPHQTTITLLNQKHHKGNVIKQVFTNIESSRRYYVDMCSEEEVEGLLESDTIVCKVMIS